MAFIGASRMHARRGNAVQQCTGVSSDFNQLSHKFAVQHNLWSLQVIQLLRDRQASELRRANAATVLIAPASNVSATCASPFWPSAIC